MADALSLFKQSPSTARRNSLVNDFTSGMMYTSSPIETPYVKTLVNYDVDKNSTALVPRAGFRTSELVLPYIDPLKSTSNFYTYSDLRIDACKECIEEGTLYKQFILGSPSHNKLFVVTSGLSDSSIINDTEVDSDIQLCDSYVDIDGYACLYQSFPLKSIHNIPITDSLGTYTLVGDFAFGNKFYFSNNTDLYYTDFNSVSKHYEVHKLEPKQIDASSAVTYGYNMLASDPYTFVSSSGNGTIQLQGILPYTNDSTQTLQMTPKKNESILFKCYVKGEVGKRYKFVWEWRNTGDTEYTTIQSLDDSPIYTMSEDTNGFYIKIGTDSTRYTCISHVFSAPTDSILIRVQAYNMDELDSLTEGYEPATEQATTFGFDFSQSSTTANLKVENYNLATCTGILYWKNRLVLYGVAADPTILFISDLNEPTYFPYPNNVSVFDEAIVAVKEYLDSLLVFTTHKIYQVTTGEDGNSWNTTLIQTNLNINEWDRPLIQIVRNMVFFKSGNYYFMVVPKSQSTTGELTIAPISNAIVEFFNNFRSNVSDLLYDTYGFNGEFNLVDYYNYFDYEDVHNIYLFKYSSVTDTSIKTGMFHLDMLYDIVNRIWRIYVHESEGYITPYKLDATQRGTFAMLSRFNTDGVTSVGSGSETLELVPTVSSVVYNSDQYRSYVSSYTLGTLNLDYSDLNDLTIKLGSLEVTFDEFYLNSSSNCLTAVSIAPHANKYSITLNLYSGSSSFQSISSNNTFDKSEGYSIYLNGVLALDNTIDPIIDNPSVIQFKVSFNRQNAINNTTVLSINGEEISLSSSTFSSVDKYNYIVNLPAETVYNLNSVLITTTFTYNTSYKVSNSLPCIQLVNCSELNIKDYHIPASLILNYSFDGSEAVCNIDNIRNACSDIITNPDNYFVFLNWQFIDTGYLKDAQHTNKRYRELQLHINNIDLVNLEFGMEFRLDGQSRRNGLTYDVEQAIDITEDNIGLVYLTATPYADLNLDYINSYEFQDYGPVNDIWSINQTVYPNRNLWKVRAPISGKGTAPRLRLVSKNTHRFSLIGIYWVYRYMHMR